MKNEEFIHLYVFKGSLIWGKDYTHLSVDDSICNNSLINLLGVN